MHVRIKCINTSKCENEPDLNWKVGNWQEDLGASADVLHESRLGRPPEDGPLKYLRWLRMHQELFQCRVGSLGPDHARFRPLLLLTVKAVHV